MSNNSEKPLAGKWFVVIGAAGKLGPIWCSAIIDAGGKVIAMGINSTTDLDLLKIYKDKPDQILLIDQDITTELNQNSIDSLNSAKISGVVLNAGIDSIPGAGYSDITKFDYDFWQRILGTNVAGVASILNHLIPLLGVDSSVVFIGSMYAVVAPTPSLYSHYNSGAGSVKNPAYAASKAALISICNQYATHFGNSGIRFNLLTLGGIEGNQDDEFKAKFKAKVPLARMGQASEIGDSLIFLLSSQSSYMTGQNLILDGGYTKW